jgi:hypothetical protein
MTHHTHEINTSLNTENCLISESIKCYKLLMARDKQFYQRESKDILN